MRPISLLAEGPGPDDVTVVSYGRVFQTDRKFRDWHFVASLPVGVHGGRAFSVGDTPAVTALHVGLDGTITVGSDLWGFVTRHPDGSIVTVEHPRRGNYATQLLSTRYGLYAGSSSQLERLDDPGWRPPWPGEAEGMGGGSWDIDETGRLRLTGIAGTDLLSVTLGGEVLRIAVPEPSGYYDLGSALRLPQEILVGGTASVRIWDGTLWRTLPRLEGFNYDFQHPRWISGSDDLLLVEASQDRPSRLWRVLHGEEAWELVRWGVSDAVIAPDQRLILATTGNVVVDGCGRIWRVQQDHISLEEQGRRRPVAVPPGLWRWRTATARPEGIALGGSGLVHDISVTCGKSTGSRSPSER